MIEDLQNKKMLDIAGCRESRPYSRSEYLGRVLWAATLPFFRFSPRSFFGWRRLLLRLFGAQIAKTAHIYPTARVYLPWKFQMGEYACVGEWALIYNLGSVKIGDRATISHRTHLCAGTHDYHDPIMPLKRLAIEVGAQAWVCADAFVGPNTRVGEGAIVGARSVVVKDVEPWQIVAGNPARFIKMRIMKDSLNEHD